MNISRDLNDSIQEILQSIDSSENDETLALIERIGKSINTKTFNTIVACGCGPSGERGVEDGVCPT
ncbi:hypothetical protein PUG81_14790 [Erwiniaceae bacterium L1_54_6]|nr:hypothetical protein [Erwiniaceae bacterium L1_54_6]